MSPSLLVVAYGLAFLFLFSLSLFLFIVLRRTVAEERKRKFERQYREIEKDVLEAISILSPEFSIQVARKYESRPAVLTQVLYNYAEAIIGRGKDHLTMIFDQALKKKCLKDLHSRRIVRRLQAARLFVVFLDLRESDRLSQLLKDKPVVRLTAINALSHFPTPETLAYIFRAFEQDSGVVVQSYFNIMYGLGWRIGALVKDYLQKPLPPQKLGLLIELVGVIPLRFLQGEIIGFANHPDKELRIKVARALGKLLIPDSLGTLTALASDGDWEVQAQAMKSLGLLGNPESLMILSDALFSPFWHVRFNAGHALANLGEAGMRRLKDVAEQKEDRYASDMAVMVMDELICCEEAA